MRASKAMIKTTSPVTRLSLGGLVCTRMGAAYAQKLSNLATMPVL